MDLKFLSLLVLIILITLYLINEFKMIKSHISINNDNINKLIKGKFHGFLSEVKELNTDLVNQTRKINKIHSQKITNMSNYFTESENDGNNIINYLSDVKETDKMFKVEHNESINKSAISQKSKHSKNNDDDIISNSSNPSNIRNINNEHFSETSTSTDKQEEVDQHIENIINLSGRLSVPENNCVQNDEVSIGSESDKSVGSEGSRKSHESHKSDKSNKSRKSEHSVYDNDKGQSEHGGYEHKSAEFDERGIDEIKIESVKFTKLNSEPEDTISIESTKLKSMHDMISFGSKKSKGNKPTLQIGALQIGKSKKDINSMDSNDIKNISTLDISDKYSKKNLDNIARVLNLDNFYKEGTKRILYKKEELYLKIKEELNKKSNQ
jgi:hypothetical protein